MGGSDVVENLIVGSIKSVFGKSCVNVCAGPWDILCFFEHFCLQDIVKFMLIIIFTCIFLMFIKILRELGVFQCVGTICKMSSSLCAMCCKMSCAACAMCCKMSCAACATYWSAIGNMVRCVWHRVANTKRVHRPRKTLPDIESGYYPNDDDNESSSSNTRIHKTRPPKQRRRLEKDYSSHHLKLRHNGRRVVRLPSRQLSIRIGGKPRKAKKSGRKAKPTKE